MYPLLIQVGIGLAFIILLNRLFAFYSNKSSLPLPPGPRRLPLIGNAHQAPQSHGWFDYYAWSKAYGPVMYLNMAGQSLVILSSTKAAHDLLSRRSTKYSDRPRLVVAELVTKGLHILLRPYNATYKLHQRIDAPVMNLGASNTYRPLQDLESRQLIADLLAGSDSSGDKGVDFHHHFERTMASTIYSLMYGYRLETGFEDKLVNARAVQDEFTQAMQVGAHVVDMFPILNHLPRFLAPWKDRSEAMYQREEELHVGNLELGLVNPGWNFSKQMMDSVEAKTLSKLEIAFNLGALADAALDTSTATVDWFIVAWITSGDSFVAKAQKLLDDVVGRDRLPSYEDRPRLAYIDALMQEVMRWRPVAAGGVPHFTQTEDEYMGYRIPAGSIILPNYWAIVREEAVFGEDTDSFVPERWLGGNGEQNLESSPLKDLPNTGFGFGRRVCTGQRKCPVYASLSLLYHVSDSMACPYWLNLHLSKRFIGFDTDVAN